MTRNKILVGVSTAYPLYEFDDDTIQSINGDLSTSIDNEQLKIDRFTFVVFQDIAELKNYLLDADEKYLKDSADLSLYVKGTVGGVSYLRDSNNKQLLDLNNKKLGFQGGFWTKDYIYDANHLKLKDSNNLYLTNVSEGAIATYGTPVWYYHDGNFKGKFFLESVERVARSIYTYNCVSAVGMLDSKLHRGGIYENATISSMLYNIIDGDVTFSCDPSIATIPVSGWLPYATKRDNLHQLLFAYNIVMTKADNGNVIFRPNYKTSAKVVEADDIYNEGSVDTLDSVSTVAVSEHTYVADTTVDAIELFNSTDYTGSVVNNLVIFNEPIIPTSLSASGTLTFTDANCNSAVVNGKGKLTGIPYTDIVKNIQRDNPDALNGKTVFVSDATLNSSSNSETLLNRLYNFYTKRQKVISNFVLNDEKCGMLVHLQNIYDEPTEGYISRMEYSVSSVTKATCEVIAGYTPDPVGSQYDTVVIYDTDTTYTYSGVASGTIKVVLVGGGNGGNKGEDGTATEVGTGGMGGTGSKVLEMTISPALGQTFAIVCGHGGNGGTSATPTGQTGTPTTFGTYSSASGSLYPTGYTNYSDGNSYGADGTNGTEGIADGLGSDAAYSSTRYGKGGDGGNGGKVGKVGSDGKRGNNGCVIIYYKQ